MTATSHDLTKLSAKELKTQLDTKTVSATEVVNAHLDRITTTEPHLQAWLAMMDTSAREHAKDIDTRRANNQPVGELAGIPVGLKDLFCTKGVATTAASNMLKNFVPPYDATTVTNLRNADAIALGKLNLDEFAMGSTTETSAFKTTKNPWDLTRIPGGSSGGSAAAVAGFNVPLATGTDTGGSIRQPASVTGIVGIKPTYGRASRYGVIAFASSLDQPGMLARNVYDAAWSLEVLCGPDPMDAMSHPEPMADLRTNINNGVKGLKIGWVPEHFGDGLNSQVGDLVKQALSAYEQMGAEIVEIALPYSKYGLGAYYLIAPAEASSNLSRHDGVRWGLRVDAPTSAEMMSASRTAGFGPEVQRRIMIGTHALSAGKYDEYFARAQRVRTLIIRDYEAAFNQVDVIVSPTNPSPAFKLGENQNDPLAMYLSDVYSVPASLAGLPAMSMPVGFATPSTGNAQANLVESASTGNAQANPVESAATNPANQPSVPAPGLPVGMQLIGAPYQEATIITAAQALENHLALDLTPRGANALEGM